MKKNTKNFLYTIIFAIIGGFHRRWFGGGFGKLGDITRLFKYIILALIVFSMYYLKDILDWQDWCMYVVLISFAIHWAVGHGTWYCFWDKSNSAEGRLPMIDKIVWFCIGKNESRTFWGNFFGMFVRYTLTAIPVAFLTSWWFLTAGLITAVCYIPAGLKKDTRIGEYLAGALNFALLYLCIGE